MTVEQLLGHSFEDGIQVIRFVRIDQDRSGSFAVSYFEVSDDGNPDFLDVYEFGAIDPEFPYGNTKSFPSAGEAVHYACEKLGAAREKFLGAGMIQVEYKETLHPDW